MQRFLPYLTLIGNLRGAVVMSVVLVACLLTGSLFGCRADSMQRRRCRKDWLLLNFLLAVPA